MEKDKYIINSVENTLKLLDLLSQSNELGVADISKILKFGRASIFRMLYTLEKNEYVFKTEAAKYKLGMKFAHYGSIVLQNYNLIDTIKPYLRKLRDKNNETTHLGILDVDFNVIFMAKELSNASFNMTSILGTKTPFYSTSMGKAMVANQLDEETEKKIRSIELIKFTDNTILNHDILIEQLKKVKEQGYSEDLEENQEGLTCYGAPLIDISGKPIAAISVSGPTSRMNARKEVILSTLKDVANEASLALGYKK